MSVETDNKSFITAVLSAVGPSLTPDFSKYTYGLWVTFFENPNHSENGYSIPRPLVEDVVASRFAVTGKKFSIVNLDGEAPKARFFLTEGLLGLNGYDYLKDFEITDRFVSGYKPSVIMPDMDFAGKIYRRYEISGLVKSKSTNNDILSVSGEDWVDTSISVNASNSDTTYTYSDAGYSGYKNEVTTRYKFLYNDSANSIVQDYSVFEIPFQLENQTSLKYRISRASEPLGTYDYADLTADGKAIIDYSKYKEEVSGAIDGQIDYAFESVAAISFSKSEFENIRENNAVKTRSISGDPFLTGFKLSKSENIFKFTLLSTGDSEDVYKLDVQVERFNTKNKPNISGYVMTSYNIEEEAVNISIASGDNVYPRISEDGEPFGYENLQDLIDVEEVQESEKYAQDIQIPDAGDEEDESQLEKNITDNFEALARAYNDDFGEEKNENQGEAWEQRALIDSEDAAYLTSANNEMAAYQTALPNFPLPKKIITKDFYSNYINSGESYIVVPLSTYGLQHTFVSLGDQLGSLGYYINEDKNASAPEPVFRTVVNSTCDGYYVDATGVCNGTSAIYDNKRYAADDLKIENGLVTQIKEDGTISKTNYISQESWLRAINYFYTKNYVTSFDVYPSYAESSYTTLFSQALRQVNSVIGGPAINNLENSFYSKGGRSPRIFVEREIYTRSYKDNETLELNQAILSGVYTPSDADLANEEKEKLYCIHSYEPNTSNSFISDKQNYFYPVQDYNEEITFRRFLENSGANLSYQTGSSFGDQNFGQLSFFDEDIEVEKLFRVEYATGNTFSYNDTSNFRAWSNTSPSTISITNEDTKSYSYHLYGYNNAASGLSFLSSNVHSGDAVSSNTYSNLVVLKFIKQGLTDSIFKTEVDSNGSKKTYSSINVSIADSSGALLSPSKVRLNIQTYDYKIQANKEDHQWVLFNQNPINNNIYGEREKNALSAPRFFEDDNEETKDVLSTLFLLPNGPHTSKNYEGKPVGTSSINGLADGLFENNIYIKEQNESSKKYESNYIIEISDNGNIVKQKPPTSNSTRFKNTRRLQITKVKYNFYTKDLVLIGDAGSPYSINFNYGWEYDLQYKAKNTATWNTMAKEGAFTKDTISSQYSAISPYYFSAEDLEIPSYLSMIAFKTNLPLFLDDNNYEFRIFKTEKLAVSSDSANVIKKTNFLPIKVNWTPVAGCGYYNIYQKDRDNNLTFLKSEPSGINNFSYVIPDVKQKNVDLGVYNFGANGINYYDIVVSGIKASVTKVKETLSGEYGFEVGDSSSNQNTITKYKNITSYTPVAVAGATYEQILNLNLSENKTSEFTVDQDRSGYYFTSNQADASLVNIPSSFESYVFNVGASSCNVGGSAVSSNQYAKISNNGTVTVSNGASLPASTLDLSDTTYNDSIYLTSGITILNDTTISSQILTLINDSNSLITGTFGSATATVAANKTRTFTFNDDGTTKSIVTGIEYSNITAQDSKIYYPKEGFINLNFSTGEFSPTDSLTDLPIYNLSKYPLTLNSLNISADSFNYVSWNGSTASKSQKNYFDNLKVYLKGTESTDDSIKLLKDDTDIILSQFTASAGSSKDYFFLKDESVNRSLNVKIINGSSTGVVPKQRPDFKLTVNKTINSVTTYSLTFPSSDPFFEISNSREQMVLLKGNLTQYINLNSLDSNLQKESFIYFINKNNAPVYFYREKQENVIYTLAENQIARGMLVSLGSTKVVRLEILNDTLSHFYFDVDSSFINSPSNINIVDLNFCGTQISLPTATSLNNKELFLICRNRFLPNKINKEKVKDVNGIISENSLPSTSEVNEIGDIASNSISLRVYGSTGQDMPTIERTSFLTNTARVGKLLDLQDDAAQEDAPEYFYVRNKDIDTFTVKDKYNRKYKYEGKIFLPTATQYLFVQSFDSSDGNGLFKIRENNSIDFNYFPDSYSNGRLQVSKPLISDAKIYSYESESGSTTKNFPNALATDQILMNFAYDNVTVSVDSVSKTLKKNRLVKNSGANYVYPIYNKKEFFIALSNATRTNTRLSGGTVFYYIINANEVDVDTIVLPDISAVVSFVIKNVSGRPYQIKTLSGVLVHTLLPSSLNNQKLFTYTGAPYTVTTDSVNFDSEVNFGFDAQGKYYGPTSIKSDNQNLELDSDHPFVDVWNSKSEAFSFNDFENFFTGETGNETTTNVGTQSYRFFDVYSSVAASTEKIIYSYGRKAININTLADKKYIVNDFYLFAMYGEFKIKREQFYIEYGTSSFVNGGVYDLSIVDANHTDLTKFFKSQSQISDLPNVIFIPITKYSSKFYLPNLQAKVEDVELSSLLAGKKILFVNLIKSDPSGANSIYNYSNNTTTNLFDINSLALFSVSGSSWSKETSNLPQVKKAFATAKNIKGVSGLSTTEITGGNEFVYLPNFNRFNVDLNSFVDKSFRDFYVFNPCKYNIYIGSNNSLLSNGAFTKVHRNETTNSFSGTSLDLNASSIFSVVTLSYAEGRAPESLTPVINELYPNLKFGTKIKVNQKIGNSNYTYLFQYDLDNKASEIIIKNKDYGVLNLLDLKSYAINDKLFIYGSSQVNDTGNSFDNYNLKILNASLLGIEKFYIYNNTPYYLTIFCDGITEPTQSLFVPPKTFVEITSSGLNFLGTYEKGKYYISKNLTNVNYLFKNDLKANINGIFNYVNLIGEEEKNADKNIILTGMVQDEAYLSFCYYKDQGLIESVSDNFKSISMPDLNSMGSAGALSYNLLKPVYRITAAGHYILDNNNRDVSVVIPGSGQVFLVNNCSRDIFVNIIGTKILRVKLFRNTVIVLESGKNIRYLKKAKNRDEFYCVLNPNTVISTQREITLNLGIIRNEELLPILDDDQVEQKSYVKLLASNGSSNSVNLALRNYYNGKDIPTDSSSSVVGYEVGIGHETIYRFLFFDPSESTYTLQGIQKGIKYKVSISKSFFDNINIPTDTAFTNVQEEPFLRYKGVDYQDGETFYGEEVTTYELKYPNFIRLYKIVEDINRPFDDAEDKGESEIDPEVTQEENVAIDELELFNAQIKSEYKKNSNSVIAWLPRGKSAFWLDSNYSDDWWTIDKVESAQTITISLAGTSKTITFTKCQIKKTDLRTSIFKYNYSYFSALKPVKGMQNNKDLTIGLDAGLNSTQIQRIKNMLGQEQYADDVLLPKSEMEIGGIYVNSLFPESTKDVSYDIINNSEVSVDLKISKIKSAPDIKFEDFSKSSVIKIINRK